MLARNTSMNYLQISMYTADVDKEIIESHYKLLENQSQQQSSSRGQTVAPVDHTFEVLPVTTS